MTTALAGAVELLDRSLAYTRVALLGLGSLPPTTPTPCHGWPLQRLLSHMDDALDAWTEAAGGRLARSPATGRPRPERIRDKACALLGRWVERGAGPVAVGDRWLPGEVVLSAAALEITLHGWDLHTAAGRPTPVPEPLASSLLTVAAAHAADRPHCFGPPPARPPTGTDADRLLALLGRT